MLEKLQNFVRIDDFVEISKINGTKWKVKHLKFLKNFGTKSKFLLIKFQSCENETSNFRNSVKNGT